MQVVHGHTVDCIFLAIIMTAIHVMVEGIGGEVQKSLIGAVKKIHLVGWGSYILNLIWKGIGLPK